MDVFWLRGYHATKMAGHDSEVDRRIALVLADRALLDGPRRSFGLPLPVFALISSVLFPGDRVTLKLIIGGLLAISGVATTQVRPSTRSI